MAYVVARATGRFEIRESLHTPKGPRARTLAGFRVLSDEVVRTAAQRAQRPFDPEAVIASARRAGAVVRRADAVGAGARDRFLAGSRRMASSFRSDRPPAGGALDPGTALIELLGFADMVMASQQPRPFEALTFPPLKEITERSSVPRPRREREQLRREREQ